MQHAGVVGINPGEAVFMEGAETLVQWRKMFFGQYGVICSNWRELRMYLILDSSFERSGKI